MTRSTSEPVTIPASLAWASWLKIRDIVLGEHRCIGVGHADADVAVSSHDRVGIDSRPQRHVTRREGGAAAEHKVGRQAASIVRALRGADLLGRGTEGREPFAHRGFLPVLRNLVIVHRQARYGARLRLRRVSGSSAALLTSWALFIEDRPRMSRSRARFIRSSLDQSA